MAGPRGLRRAPSGATVPGERRADHENGLNGRNEPMHPCTLRRPTRRTLAAFVVTGALVAMLPAGTASAETATVRLAEQFGLGYLPMMVMREHAMIEKHAEKAGLPKPKVEWLRFSGGAAMNEALLSDNLDVASGGVGPLVTIWARTRGNFKVHGIAALNSMPLYLNTTNPNVKTIADFTEKDRIALPAVRVSIQAVTLQIAAEKIFGVGNHTKLDKLTVSMTHPDATAAILSGKTEVTGHLTSPPFQYQQLKNPAVRRVFSSYDVMGGKTTFNSLWARSSFREKNPKTYKALVAAMNEAVEWIKADAEKATDVYMKQSKTKLDRAFILSMVKDPEIEFTTTPKNTMGYAGFMHRIGSIKEKPASWKDYYFPEIHDKPGS
jgi:NitT/TauT family transport system substrate-binding protein